MDLFSSPSFRLLLRDYVYVCVCVWQEFNKRILVSTDLFGRGIDIERVNIVINYDFPDQSDQVRRALLRPLFPFSLSPSRACS